MKNRDPSKSNLCCPLSLPDPPSQRSHSSVLCLRMVSGWPDVESLGGQGVCILVPLGKIRPTLLGFASQNLDVQSNGSPLPLTTARKGASSWRMSHG